MRNSNSLLPFSPILNRHRADTLAKHFVTACIMLTAFFILAPLAIAALFGFARLVNPRTGQIGSR
ncbi:hypothetical protein NH14_024820 [Paraburkholderia sacchari]|uniref:Uncharacterized protein n=1 Tax=Paraburkholderia sacchari TaxID=159450 RepID=A0A8T6ZJ93_9BURK|nr:hypothetical protein [Paraburkholderia sacchari]